MRPLRIAVINSIRAYGGGEKWVLQFAGGMTARGHEVTVIPQPGSELARRVPADRSITVTMRHDLSPAAVLGLRKALRAAGSQAAICCNERAVRLGAVAACLAGGLPVVYRNGLEGSFRNKAHNRWIAAPLIRRYVVNAEALRAEYAGYGWIPMDRVRRIYNGVDLPEPDAETRAAARAELGAGDADTVVLLAARMVSEKGHALLVDAAGATAHEHPALRVWLAGDGPELASIKGLVDARGLGGIVSVLGFRSDIPRLLQGADVLCHPSRREGAPNIVLEGMAAGLPVVGLRAPGTAELVEEGVTGLLAPLEHPAELTDRLLRLVGDPGLRWRLGEAGRERVARLFSTGRSLDDWSDLLTELVPRG